MSTVNRITAYGCMEESSSSEPDRRDLEVLLAEFDAELRSFIFALLPSWQDVEEVMQRTRIVLWKKFDSFTPGTDFCCWAKQIARFEIKNFNRTKRRDRHLFADDVMNLLEQAHSSISVELERRRRLLDHCIAKLKPAQRQMIQRCYGPGATSMRDVADQMHRTANALYRTLSRIRGMLMECVRREAEKGS